MPLFNRDEHSYWSFRMLSAYLLPPVMAVYGLYCAIKMEFVLGQFRFVGPLAILAGLGLVALGVVLLVLLHLRDWIHNRGRFD
jgi:hypothetical protein